MTILLWDNVLKRTTGEKLNSIHFVLDRIAINKAYHRLAGKTQIFSANSHDHVQNRLTHTLTVANISRFIARVLGLDELHSEVIALCHDIGHTPFGHAGERFINRVMNGCGGIVNKESISNSEASLGFGFKHNLQSAHLCTKLEDVFDGKNRANHNYSTARILYGVISHSSVTWDNCLSINNHTNGEKCHGCSLSFYNSIKKVIRADNYIVEAEVVAMADEIAQRQHDILDAYYMKLMSFREIKELIKPIVEKASTSVRRSYDRCKEGEHKAILELSRCLAGAYIENVVETSMENLRALKGTTIQNNIAELRNANPIKMTHELTRIDENIVKATLKTTVLNSHHVQRLDGVAEYVIRKLYQAYLENPMQLYDPTIITILKRYKELIGEEDTYKYDIKKSIGEARRDLMEFHKKRNDGFIAILLRGITDHIAGMTDAFAIKEYRQLYGQEIATE